MQLLFGVGYNYLDFSLSCGYLSWAKLQSLPFSVKSNTFARTFAKPFALQNPPLIIPSFWRIFLQYSKYWGFSVTLTNFHPEKKKTTLVIGFLSVNFTTFSSMSGICKVFCKGFLRFLGNCAFWNKFIYQKIQKYCCTIIGRDLQFQCITATKISWRQRFYSGRY